MEEKLSLYNDILLHLTDGLLPAGYALPPETDSDGISFGDGVQDGLTMYHGYPREMTPEENGRLAEAITASALGEWQKAEALFQQLGKTFATVRAADAVQQFIMDHMLQLPANPMFESAMAIVLNSRSRDAVKYALIMLELLSMPDQVSREIVRTIALSDEFTLYAVWVMRQWENGDEELFRLMHKVHGWGRIHILQNLEPLNEEMRDDLLYQGLENDVSPAYAAAYVWDKAGVKDRLAAGCSDEEFNAITSILTALLDIGPIDGIQLIEEAETGIRLYMAEGAHHPYTLDYCYAAMLITEWAMDENSDFPDIVAECGNILAAEDCVSLVREAVKEGKALKIAEALEIDYAEDLFACLTDDFEAHYKDCCFLMQDDYYADKTFDLFYERLTDGSLPASLRENALNAILAELPAWPGKGKELIELALGTGSVRSRLRALDTLQAWVDDRGAPLSEWLPELADAAEALARQQNPEAVQQKLKDLLDVEPGKGHGASED